MIQPLPILPGLPVKPAEGQPCNRCGLCCTLEICAVGLVALGLLQIEPPADAAGPCPFLVLSDVDTACGLVLEERAQGLDPLLLNRLGIGHGCCMSDAPT